MEEFPLSIKLLIEIRNTLASLSYEISDLKERIILIEDTVTKEYIYTSDNPDYDDSLTAQRETSVNLIYGSEESWITSIAENNDEDEDFDYDNVPF